MTIAAFLILLLIIAVLLRLVGRFRDDVLAANRRTVHQANEARILGYRDGYAAGTVRVPPDQIEQHHIDTAEEAARLRAELRVQRLLPAGRTPDRDDLRDDTASALYDWFCSQTGRDKPNNRQEWDAACGEMADAVLARLGVASE